MDEFKLIEKMAQILGKAGERLGDDCADLGDGLIATVDAMVENVHFLPNTPPDLLAKKLVATNVSDITASGGAPLWGLINLNLPQSLGEQWVEKFYAGLKDALAKYRFNLAGGNTSRAGELSFSLTLIGKAKRFIPRSGAKNGDLVFLTGKTGLSAAGLAILLKAPDLLLSLSDRSALRQKLWAHGGVQDLGGSLKNLSYHDLKLLLERHLVPRARTDALAFLQKAATAAIDISDGLVADLGHLCASSGVAINLTDLALPTRLVRIFGKKSAMRFALSGGEDYEIAFTTPPKYKQAALDLGFLHIGTVSDGAGVFYGGKALECAGFNHFKARAKGRY